LLAVCLAPQVPEIYFQLTKEIFTIVPLVETLSFLSLKSLRAQFYHSVTLASNFHRPVGPMWECTLSPLPCQNRMDTGKKSHPERRPPVPTSRTADHARRHHPSARCSPPPASSALPPPAAAPLQRASPRVVPPAALTATPVVPRLLPCPTHP
jgi:hypothetical protein